MQAVRLKVLIPVTGAISLLLVSFALTYSSTIQQFLDDNLQRLVKQSSDRFRQEITHNANLLSASLVAFENNDAVAEAFRARDRDLLLQLVEPLYQQTLLKCCFTAVLR